MGRGNFHGSGIVSAVEYFVQKHGNAAANDVVAKLPREHRQFVKPNSPNLGLLGARMYPYPFVGELVRTMIAVVHPPDEDAYIREIVAAGMDATIGTINRIILRYIATPADHAANAQRIWNLYHDSGVVKVLVATQQEYTVENADWPNHDVTVCKICLEARRRVLEKTGVPRVDATRLKCQAWGHESCVFRFRTE
jgi:hypothetical protein